MNEIRIRVLRSYYNDKEGSVKAGTIKDVSPNRAEHLVKRGLAVCLAPEPAKRGQRGAPLARAKAAAKKAAGKTAAKTAPKNSTPAASRTGARRAPSSSPQDQVPEIRTSPGTGTGENGNGDNSAS